MQMTIRDTLAEILTLRSPVIRSCHVGNNTANNWAWLVLAPNSRMVQYDHTMYGVDEVALAWLKLGDRGRVDAGVNHKGLWQQAWIGRHVNEVVAELSGRQLAHLNYGIHAELEGEDLLTWHCRVSEELAHEKNASHLAFDSTEALRHTRLVAEIAKDFCRVRSLHKMFDRWVKRSRKGYVTMEKISTIDYESPDEVIVRGVNSVPLFTGSLDGLIVLFTDGMKSIDSRLRTGVRTESLNYPWLSLCFNYIFHAINEFALDPTQRVFWHAGGSASSYYINDPKVRSEFNELRDILVSMGHLPLNVRLRFIPTFACQLFALSKNSLDIMDCLLATWGNIVTRYADVMRVAGEQLQGAPHPSAIVDRVLSALPRHQTNLLASFLSHFNAQSEHQLPIAHMVGQRQHPTYNKYGIAQRHLRGSLIEFPERIRSFTWGDIELLVKVLAMLAIDEAL